MNTLTMNDQAKKYCDDDILEMYVNKMILEHKEKTIDFLCEKGNLDALVFINNSNKFNLPWSQTNMITAIENRHLHVVKWLHLNRKEGCTSEALALANLLGYLEIVKFFRSSHRKY